MEASGALNEWDDLLDDPQVVVDRDYSLALRALDSGSMNPLVRIWRNRRALVVPRSFRGRKGFADAVARCCHPVLLRRSGGTTVMHGPHILNLSLIAPIEKGALLSITGAYNQLGHIILPELHRRGVPAELMDVADAHCPGRFTIAVNGRKLAGTAAFVCQSQNNRAIVCHANLVLDENQDDLKAITSFERKLGFSPNYASSAHTSLAAEIALVMGRPRIAPHSGRYTHHY